MDHHTPTDSVAEHTNRFKGGRSERSTVRGYLSHGEAEVILFGMLRLRVSMAALKLLVIEHIDC